MEHVYVMKVGNKTVNCSDCLQNYYGSNCTKCTVDCHEHGHCLSGVNGSNRCVCDSNFNPDVNCKSEYQSVVFPPFTIAIITVACIIAIVVLVVYYRDYRRHHRYRKIN